MNFLRQYLSGEPFEVRDEDLHRSVRAAPPRACEDCGARNPHLIDDGIDESRWVCDHRRACEARQMLQRGEPRDAAIRHAQQLDDKAF